MDLAPFARMDDPIALPPAQSQSASRRRKFQEDDEDEDHADDPMINKSSPSKDLETTSHVSSTPTSSTPFNFPSYTEGEEEKTSVHDQLDLGASSLMVDHQNTRPFENPFEGTPRSLTLQQPSEEDEEMMNDVDINSNPSPHVSPSKSPTSPHQPQQQLKRSYESGDEFSSPGGGGRSGGREDSGGGASMVMSPTLANRNKATEPSVFWGEHREWLKTIEKISFVSVDEPMQLARSLINPNPPFTYLVKSSMCKEGVRRRYSDFELLRNCLASKFPGILLLALPEKKAVGNTADEFLYERAKGLKHFLEKVIENEYLIADGFVRSFLTFSPMEWEGAKKRIATLPATGSFGNLPEKLTSSVASSGANGGSSAEERWRSAVHMTRLPDKYEEETSRSQEALIRLESALKSLVTCANKCAVASRAYSLSIRDLHRQFVATSLTSLSTLNDPLELWSEASALEPILMEELLSSALQKELDMVSEMKRMLEQRKELVVVADYKLGVLHKYEDERQGNEKTGQLDRAQRSAQKVQDALKQVKQADYRLEMMTKALFLGGLSTFAPRRMEAISNLMGKFAFGELRFGDLMKSVWLGVVASLRLDLSQIEEDARNAMLNVQRQVPDKFRGMFATMQ